MFNNMKQIRCFWKSLLVIAAMFSINAFAVPVGTYTVDGGGFYYNQQDVLDLPVGTGQWAVQSGTLQVDNDGTANISATFQKDAFRLDLDFDYTLVASSTDQSVYWAAGEGTASAFELFDGETEFQLIEEVDLVGKANGAGNVGLLTDLSKLSGWFSVDVNVPGMLPTLGDIHLTVSEVLVDVSEPSIVFALLIGVFGLTVSQRRRA
jgi:hypothetical protein